MSDTHRCSPLVYLHLKRSIFLQLKLYIWGPWSSNCRVLALNSWMVAAATVLAGRRFQSLAVRWKKEFLYVSLLVLSWKRRCWPLVLLSLCLIYKSLVMSIRLCWILYSVQSLLFCLLCSKLCQPSDAIMLVTQPCVRSV